MSIKKNLRNEFSAFQFLRFSSLLKFNRKLCLEQMTEIVIRNFIF